MIFFVVVLALRFIVRLRFPTEVPKANLPNTKVKREVLVVFINISPLPVDEPLTAIDLLAILQKSLDRAIFLYNFIREVR